MGRWEASGTRESKWKQCCGIFLLLTWLPAAAGCMRLCVCVCTPMHKHKHTCRWLDAARLDWTWLRPFGSFVWFAQALARSAAAACFTSIDYYLFWQKSIVIDLGLLQPLPLLLSMLQQEDARCTLHAEMQKVKWQKCLKNLVQLPLPAACVLWTRPTCRDRPDCSPPRRCLVHIHSHPQSC